MSSLTDDYEGDVLDLFGEDKANPKGRVGEVYYSYYDNRFSSPSYVRSLTNVSYKQQVVIKVICKGFGKSHLSTLLNYLQREQEAQKSAGEKPVSLYSSDFYGMNATETKELLGEWVKRFDAQDGKPVSEDVEIFASRHAELSDLKSDGLASVEELRELDWMSENKEMMKRTRFTPKDFTHMMFSPGGQFKKEDGLQVMAEFLDERIGQRGYEYVFAYHDDTKNPHFHVVVNHRPVHSREERFALDKDDLFVFRQDFARRLDAAGIDRVATKRFDRTEYLNDLRKAPERIRENIDRFEHLMGRTDHGFSFDAFEFRKNIRKKINAFQSGLEKSIEYGENDTKTKLALLKVKDIKKDFLTVEPGDFVRMRDAAAESLDKLDERIGEEFYQSLYTEKKQKQDDNGIVEILEQKRERLIQSALIELNEMKCKDPEEDRARRNNIILLERLLERGSGKEEKAERRKEDNGREGAD